MTVMGPARRIIGLLALWIGFASAAAADGAVQSDWVEGFNNKARLVAGRGPEGPSGPLYVGVEIAMPVGWKTYWRAPGDAGGVPPEFDWQGSENLASAHVLYPAPRRLADKSGDVVGYKDHAIFPIALTASDPSKPIQLRVKVNYGVCKELCVPAEVELGLDVPADSATSPELSAALTDVPGNPRSGVDPVLSSWSVEDLGGRSKLVLHVTSQSPGDADAFVDADGGIFIPLPKRVATKDGDIIFEVDLTDGVDIKDIKGKPLAVTLVDGKGQSEAKIKLK